jgi:hypothetical protein
LFLCGQTLCRAIHLKFLSMTDFSWLGELLAFALPSGFLGAAVSWFVGRRRRDNDFLAEMQRSIDLLSEKYNQVLQENVMLRQEKAQWQVAQQTLLAKVDRLTREVEDLRRRISPRLFNRIKL